MPKHGTIAICADDFGLSYAVSKGILEAVDAGRLSAVSVMTNMPHWPALGRDLARRAPDVDVGLHLNLTLGRPLTDMPHFAPDGAFPPLQRVIRQALRRRLPLDELRAEIDRQLDRFEAVMERAPDFVDGHQHVHALPGLRRVLLDALESRGLADRIWLRDSGDALHRVLARGAQAKKALTVRLLTLGFRGAAKARGFRLNDGFAGYSDFNPGQDYAAQFLRFLRAPGRAHLVMCHPGHVDDDLRALDPVTVTREQELAFLLSPGFADMLAARGLRVARLGKPPRDEAAAA